MKKYILSLIPTLILITSFHCSASGFVLDPSTISTIESGSRSILGGGFGSEGVFPMYGDFDNFSLPFDGETVSGSDVVTLGSSYEVTKLDDEAKTTLSENYPLYYSLSNDTDYTAYDGDVYLVEFDNGFITGNCYVTSDGKLISSSRDVGGVYLNYKLGGFDKTLEDFQTMYKTAGDQIKNTSLTVNNSFQNVSDSSFFWWIGSSYHSSPSGAWQVYIANQYIPGVIVPATTSGYISSWYTNNPSLINYRQTHYYQNDPQYSENRLTITTGNFTKNGFSYHYQVTYTGFVSGYNDSNGNPVIQSYSDWVNGISSSVSYWFAQTGIVYNSTYDYANSHTFVPVDNLDLADGSYYDYSTLEYIDSLIGWSEGDINPDFDNTGAIGVNNYPYDYPIPDDIDTSGYPLPGGVTLPIVVPGIGEDVGSLDGSIIGENLPVLNNLFKRFPFSIPWDVYHLAESLQTERETPYIDTIITIPAINYQWHIQLDLHQFDDTASLFRILFLLSFIVALAWFSYDHFFGS